MITRKLIEELKGDKYRRQINQFSAVLLMIFGVFFGFDVLTQKQNQTIASSGGSEVLTQNIIIDGGFGEPAMIVDEQTAATEVVTNQLEPQAENTSEAEDTAATQSTEVSVAISTNTFVSSTTSLSTSIPTPTSVSGSSGDSQIYYAVTSANLRPCPYINDSCSVTTSLRKGTGITITGEVEGDAFQGSTLWYSIEYNGQTAYVHSALVSPLPPTP